MLLCAFLNTSCNVGLHYLDDRTLEYWLITEQEQRRAELQEQGASEDEISDAMLGIERLNALTLGWERPTVKKYLIIALASTAAGLLIGWAIYLFFIRKEYRGTIILLTVLLFLSGGIWRTFLFVSDTRFLMIAVSMEREHYAYSETGFLTNPEIALFILREMPWLHSDCGYWSRNSFGCEDPLLHLAASSFDLGDGEVRERAYVMAEWLIERGADVNAYADGFTPAHIAVLYNEPVFLTKLINSGASLISKIDRPGKPVDGMTPLEYAWYLDTEKKVSRKEIITILEQE